MSNEVDTQLDEMQEIIQDFLVEADELIASLDTNFVKLESLPDDPDLLNEIFRAAHTIKGTSSFLGFEQVTTLSHRMEDVLNKLRKSEMVVTPDIMDVLLEALDLLKELLEHVRSGSGEEIDLTGILNRLMASITSQEGAAAKEAPSGEDEPDELQNPPPETPPAPVTTTGTTAEKPVAPQLSGPSKRPAAGQTIRVDVDRLDMLMNMMGELVLGRNSLVQSANKLNSEHEGEHELDQLNQSVTAVNFITTELQMAVMKMRMLPIGKVFGRFPRLVRDLARDSGKQIQLKLSGESTELDKSIIEEIGDPLVHIIRNSCGHGLETPDERTARGKPPTGTVHLAASQEGSNIVIKITDDGRGLDVAAIRTKAVERGLATKADVEKMPDRDVFRFIFGAGFSTAKKVTDVSGRGVGMDVVRSNIEKLNGLIELESERDVGTTVTIKLALTLAIIQGLLVDCDDEVFILPLSSVLETVKTQQSDVSYINQRPVLRLRDEIIPVINLVEVLKTSQAGFVLTEKPYIVVVGLAEKKLGLVVDRFLGQEEVVIKSLGNYLGTTEGIAGGTILGDGRIRLIVDLIGLFSIARKLS
ncbi:MAG: chemotaxis protein CheA [bacterium]